MIRLIRCDITNWSEILIPLWDTFFGESKVRSTSSHAVLLPSCIFINSPIYLCVKLWFIKICFSQANEIAGMHFGAAESWFNMAFRRISWETGNKVVTNTIITLEVNLPTIVSPPLFPPRPLILGFGDRSDSVGDSKIMIRLSPNQINAF